MSDETPMCGVCGQPMEEIEKNFRYHGLLGPCPKKEPDATPGSDGTTVASRESE